MTDEKKKRNASELSIGGAVKKILAIRADLSSAIEKAKRDVEDRFVGKEAAILERVPEEARGIVRQKADAAGSGVGIGAGLVPLRDDGPPPIPPLVDPDPTESEDRDAAELAGTKPYVPGPVASAARGRR